MDDSVTRFRKRGLLTPAQWSFIKAALAAEPVNPAFPQPECGTRPFFTRSPVEIKFTQFQVVAQFAYHNLFVAAGTLACARKPSQSVSHSLEWLRYQQTEPLPKIRQRAAGQP